MMQLFSEKLRKLGPLYRGVTTQELLLEMFNSSNNNKNNDI